MQWLTSGQMAKLNQMSEQTLRLYDKKGLLSPSKRGEDNQYRSYDIKQSAVLDKIQYRKSLGLNPPFLFIISNKGASDLLRRHPCLYGEIKIWRLGNAISLV